MAFVIDFDGAIKLISPVLVAIVGAFLKNALEKRPQLVTYLMHSVAHPIPADPETGQTQPNVHTHTVVVMNAGKKTATNVRIDHAFFPPSYVVTPPVSHTVTPGQGGSAEICIPVLVPNEQVSISYLYFPPITWGQINGWVKCDEGMAKVIKVIPSSPPSKPLKLTIVFLSFVGASTVLYSLLRMLPYLLS